MKSEDWGYWRDGLAVIGGFATKEDAIERGSEVFGQEPFWVGRAADIDVREFTPNSVEMEEMVNNQLSEFFYESNVYFRAGLSQEDFERELGDLVARYFVCVDGYECEKKIWPNNGFPDERYSACMPPKSKPRRTPGQIRKFLAGMRRLIASGRISK